MRNCNDQNSGVPKKVHNLIREPMKQEATSALHVSRPGIRSFCDRGKCCKDLQLECGSSGRASLAIPIGRRETFRSSGIKNLNDGRHSP